MYNSAPRKARIYDRLEGAERLEAPRRRFAEVDAGAEALRPGAVVALAFDCDELLTARRSSEGGGQWALATAATDWSSRGASGWHTHAGDYAVESLEPDSLFRVLRDGPRIALASVAADGHLLCASSTGDQLGLTAYGSGGWAAVGASWEQRDGAICNSRWPDKVLAVRLLHITCLPTTQMQRVEEFFGGLMHEVHAEKAMAEKRARGLEEQRDVAVAEAFQLRHALELAQEQLEEQRQEPQAAKAPELTSAGQADVTVQLSALQQQLESLAADGNSAQLQQERARMSICLRTIKEITDLVRQSGSATPSSKGCPSPEPATDLAEGGQSCSPESSKAPSPVQYADATEGESRLRDFLGVRPEQADPLERVLEAPVSSVSPESPSRRVLQALALAGNDSVDDGSSVSSDAKGGSAPPTVRKGRRNPLLASLSLAVSQLAEGSPRQADGMAQFIATPSTLHPTTSAHPLRASHPQPQPKRASPLRASQHSRLSTRSSFLKRPPADMVDLYRC